MIDTARAARPDAASARRRGRSSGELLDVLTQPGFYPSRPARVEVCETHISWVFLAGERAYKLKKPVVLPFVDYGSVAKRHRMCREEVRLNRRLAGDIYLGVRSIAAGEEGLELAAEDDPRAVDYVVEMRRYDSDRTLAARLDDEGPGGLGEDVDALAAALARFHASAPRRPAGGPPWLAVRARLSANFDELLAVAGSAAYTRRVLALERFSSAFVAAQAAIFEDRVLRGCVVEGHGDVRCSHVLLDGGVHIVDCLEFDRSMRQVDVADELAFLAMDLVLHGGGRLVSRLVDSYCQAGGDPGDPALRAFYACFRALVRAKVALVSASQQPQATGGAHRARAPAGKLLRLAERFAWQARLPLVIVVCGGPAAGKSSLASALSAVAGLPRVSSDVVRKRAAGIALDARAPQSAYTSAANERIYEELGRRAARAAQRHGGAVLDATFRRRVDRDTFRRAFADAAPSVFVECSAPLGVAMERARRREAAGGSESDASAAVVRREHGRWEPLDDVPSDAHLMLRGDRATDLQLEDLQDMLDRRIAC